MEKRKKRKKKRSKESSPQEREQATEHESLQIKIWRRRMNFAIYGLGALAGIGFVVFSVRYSHDKSHALWFFFFPSLLILSLAACLFWQRSMSLLPKLEEPTFREKFEEVSIFLGAGGAEIVTSMERMEKGPVTAFVVGPNRGELYIENGGLYANVTMHAGAGKPVVELKGNEFVVRRPDWDRNFSDTALEVVDKIGFPVLQIIRKTPGQIVVNGFFATSRGILVANDDGAIWVVNSPTRVVMTRIFKYPSWKHPGEYEEGTVTVRATIVPSTN